MEGHAQVVEAIKGLREDLAERHLENTTAIGVTEKKVDEAIRRIDDLHEAFPGGDWEGHRRYHEAIIKKLEAREQFYQELRSELAKKGVWAVLALVGVALWQYFKAKVAS